MFVLLILGVVAVTSVVAVVTDVRTDGYSYHADQKVLQFS